MDESEIIPDDSLSQYLTVVSGQDIEESISQTSASSVLQEKYVTGKADQYMVSFNRAKTIFEVTDEHSAEEAKKFLKIHAKIC